MYMHAIGVNPIYERETLAIVGGLTAASILSPVCPPLLYLGDHADRDDLDGGEQRSQPYGLTQYIHDAYACNRYVIKLIFHLELSRDFDRG